MPPEASTEKPARTRRAPRKAGVKPRQTKPIARGADVADPSDDETVAEVGTATVQSGRERSRELARRRSQATEASDAWFSMARSGQESAINTVRRFVDLVDSVLPVQGGDDSRRRKLVDGAFDLVDRAAEAQLGMMRSAVQSAVLVYVDVGVHTDVDAFNGVDVDVDVSVPTDVGAFKTKGNDQM